MIGTKMHSNGYILVSEMYNGVVKRIWAIWQEQNTKNKPKSSTKKTNELL